MKNIVLILKNASTERFNMAKCELRALKNYQHNRYSFKLLRLPVYCIMSLVISRRSPTFHKYANNLCKHIFNHPNNIEELAIIIDDFLEEIGINCIKSYTRYYYTYSLNKLETNEKYKPYMRSLIYLYSRLKEHKELAKGYLIEKKPKQMIVKQYLLKITKQNIEKNLLKGKKNDEKNS